MLQKKNDFVKYGCERIGKYWYVKLGKKMYKLKKSKHAINYSPIHISDYMSGKMENIVAISTPCHRLNTHLICLLHWHKSFLR